MKSINREILFEQLKTDTLNREWLPAIKNSFLLFKTKENILKTAGESFYINRVPLFCLIIIGVIYFKKLGKNKIISATNAIIFGIFLMFTFTLYEFLFLFDYTPHLCLNLSPTDKNVWMWTIIRVSLGSFLIFYSIIRYLFSPKFFPNLLSKQNLTYTPRYYSYCLLILIFMPLFQHIILGRFFQYHGQPADSVGRYIPLGLYIAKNGLVQSIKYLFLEYQVRFSLPLIPLIWSYIFRYFNEYLSMPRATSVILSNHIFSIVFYQFAILSVYLLAKELFEERIGIYSALFLSVLPYFMFHGYFVLVDIPLTSFMTLTLFLFLKAIKKESIVLGLISGIFLMMAIFTKYIGLYVIFLVFGLYILYGKKKLRILLAAILPFFLSASIFILIFISLKGGVWLNKFIDMLLRYAILHFFTLQPSETSILYGARCTYFYFFDNIVSCFTFPIVCFISFAMIAWSTGNIKYQQTNNILKFLFFWILFPIVFFFPAGTKEMRYLISSFPAYTIIGAVGFQYLESKIKHFRISFILLLIVLLIILAQSASYYFSETVQTMLT